MRLDETRGVGPVLAMMARGERYKEPVAQQREGGHTG